MDRQREKRHGHLRERLIILRLRRFVQAPLSNVADNSNDLLGWAVVAGPDALAERLYIAAPGSMVDPHGHFPFTLNGQRNVNESFTATIALIEGRTTSSPSSGATILRTAAGLISRYCMVGISS